MAPCVLETRLPGVTAIARGKVRDTYAVDDRHLLIVATDRISAFDVIMKTGIPDKGRVLTQMTLFWLEMFADACPNHLVSADVGALPPALAAHADVLGGRSMLVKRLKMLPVEAIVRGYIAGSGWKEYKAKGTVCDIPLPSGLRESERLPEPIYTPSTKAEEGHDLNIHPDEAAKLLGPDVARRVAELSVTLYRKAADYAVTRGILIADTKFEFGLDEDGNVVLADEVLTPDSSRFWPADRYEPGRGQPSFDKQYVRDWLESVHFDKNGPGVELPPNVVANTADKYREAYERLTGRAL
jgi:phosphoribosylaminoimidazole-succinocarboxamide synthase